MSNIIWLLSGLLNLAGGVTIAAIRWPVWQIQAPADLLFMAVPLVGAVNALAAWRFKRGWWLLLPANALCGLVLGLFAAWHFKSFGMWLAVTFLGTAPSGLAFAKLLAARLKAG